MANVFGFGPMGALPSAESTEQKPKGPGKEHLEQLARQTKVPVNILMALEENGIGSERSAADLSVALQGNAKLEDALAKVIGDPAKGAAIMSRAYDIADQLYPRAPASQTPAIGESGSPVEANALRDVPAALGSTIARSVGGVVKGVGEFASETADMAVDNVINPAMRGFTGDPEAISGPTPNVLDAPAEAIGGDSGVAGFLDQFVSEEVKREKAELIDPNADLFKPETWTLGPKPTVRGAIYSALDVFGSMAPIVATAAITRSPTAAAAVGGAMSGGDGAQNAEDTIDMMAATKLPDGRSQLEAESSVYQRLIADGMSPEDALFTTKREAAKLAAVYASIPGALGGAATARIVNGLGAAASRLPWAGRAAAQGALSGAEEGAQEVAEGIASRTALNEAAGLDRSTTAGTMNEFMLGAMGGAPMGAIGGALQPRAPGDQTPGGDGSNPRVAPNPSAPVPGAAAGLGATEPMGGAAPVPPMAGPDAVAAPLGPLGAVAESMTPKQQPTAAAPPISPAAPAAPPAGPLEAAARNAPDLTPKPEAPQIFPEFKPGAIVRLKDPETQVIIEGTFLGETPEGVMLRVSGGEIGVPADEFDAAIKAAKVDDEAAATAFNGKPKDVRAPTLDLQSGQVIDPLAALPKPEKDKTPDAKAKAQPVDAAPVQQPAGSGALAGTGETGDAQRGNVTPGTPDAAPAADNTGGPSALPSGVQAGADDKAASEPVPSLTPGPDFGARWDALTADQRFAMLRDWGPTGKPERQREFAGKAWADLDDGVTSAIEAMADRRAKEQPAALPKPEEKPAAKVEESGETQPKPEAKPKEEPKPKEGKGPYVSDEAFRPAVEAQKNFKVGQRVEFAQKGPFKQADGTFIDEAIRRGTITRINTKEGQGTVDVLVDGGVGGKGYDVFIGADRLRPESPKAEPKPETPERGEEKTAPPWDAMDIAERLSLTRLAKIGSLNEPMESWVSAARERVANADWADLPWVTRLAIARVGGDAFAAELARANAEKAAAKVDLDAAMEKMWADLKAEVEAEPLPPVPTPDVAKFWDESSGSVRAAMATLAGLDPMTLRKLRWGKISPADQLAIAKARIEQDKADELLSDELRRMWQGVIDAAGTGIDAAAAAADPNPTPAQAEAGNYKKGHHVWKGLDLSIETAKGTERKKEDADGNVLWSVPSMPAHYGYIKRTTGADGEQVDFYFGENADSDYVWLVDQKDAETGKFDEHKAIFGVKGPREARAIYLAGFSDGKGEKRLGGATPMTVETFKEWLANGDTTKPMSARMKAQQEAEAKKGEDKPKAPKVEKIEDFGEKLGGMRKDAVKNYMAELAGDMDVASMSLSDAFPIPNFEALAADGVPKRALAAVAMLRQGIWRKPTARSWKVRDWANEVEAARSDAARILEPGADVDQILLERTKNKPQAGVRKVHLDVMERLEVADIAELMGSFDVGSNTFYDQVKQARGRFFAFKKVGTAMGSRDYVLAGKYVEVDGFENYEVPAAQLDELATLATGLAQGLRDRRQAEKGAKDNDAKEEKPIELTTRMWRRDGTWDVFVTKPFNAITSMRFASSADARAFMAENADKLQALARALLKGPNERNPANRDRNGPVWRVGDATDELFEKELGFRGVGFGKKLPPKERQALLNQTYDAFMDLAGLLNVPPKTLSLNGRLGLGFATHGKGGRGHWSAVFYASTDPKKDQIIALTRRGGPGTLAHEWWHAVDNYLARMDAADSDVSAAITGKKAYRRNEFMSDRQRYRGAFNVDEYAAFQNLRQELKGSSWGKRMERLDAIQGGDPYWGTTIELAARAFERLVIDELAKRDMVNDFLANVDQRSGAYPTSGEFHRSGIGEAFTKALAIVSNKLNVDGKPGPKLFDVIEGRGLQDPKVGDSWKWAGGSRSITAYDEATGRYTITDSETGDTRRADADRLAILQGEDAESLTPAGLVQYELEKSAQAIKDGTAQIRDEATRKRMALRAKAKDAAARLPDLVKRFEAATGKKNVLEKLRRKVYNFAESIGSASVGTFVAYAVEDGSKVQPSQSLGGYISDPNGPYTVSGKDGADLMAFAAWYQAEREKDAAILAAAEQANNEVEPAPDQEEGIPELKADDEPDSPDDGGDYLDMINELIEEEMKPEPADPEPDAPEVPEQDFSDMIGDLINEEVGTAQAPAENSLSDVPGTPRIDQNYDLFEFQWGRVQTEIREAIENARDWSSFETQFKEKTVKISFRDGVKISGVRKVIPIKQRSADEVIAEVAEVLGGIAKPAPALSPDAAKITEAFLTEFRAGRAFRNIIAARQVAAEAIGRKVEDTDYLMVEEAIELAVVKRAREIAAQRDENGERDAVMVFSELMDLYNAQPILGEKTPDKMRYQAYSTPAPLAYLASRLAGIGPETRVVEPTAGNGMLVMEAAPANVQANELQASRAAQLADALPGAALTTADALDMTFQPFDVLITNPPFGKLTDQETQTRKEFPLGATTTKEIDHAIAWHGLSQMPDDGRAVLILGGVKKNLTEDQRSKAYQERAKTVFFKQLYDAYNVVEHFTVAGELYARQGAGWPVDVIVIDGKSASSLDYPMKSPPPIYSTWAELGRKLNNVPDVDTTGRGPADSGDRAANAGNAGEPGGVSRVPAGSDIGNGGTGQSGNAGAGAGTAGGVGPAGGGAGTDADIGASGGARPAGDGNGNGSGNIPDQPGGDGQRPGDAGSPAVADDPRVSQPGVSDLVSSAIKNAASGTGDGLEGLINLFGGKNGQLNSGLPFSRETYEAAKPFFIAAVKKFGKAGQDIKEILRAVVKAFVERFRATGASDAQVRESVQGMTPYINEFGKEVSSGALDPFADAQPEPKADTKAPDRVNTEQATEFQVQYTPRSKTAYAVGTLVPNAMQAAITRALDRIEAEHGDIDAYVAKELGYTLKEILGTKDKPGYFSAEQIDALALAIKNVSEGKGFINGDQTGVGKGRFVAAMLRYGMRKGLIPVFVTQKPGLYADMVRDMRDIGMTGIEDQIIATNTKLRSEPVPISGPDDLFVGPTKKEYDSLVAALRQGKMPDGKKILFTTYDQMKTKGGKLYDRGEALRAAAPKTMLVLDESHTAGGDASGSFKDSEDMNVAKFFRELVQVAQGTVYASATYAKNPAVMSLYSPTNLSLAVENMDDLGPAIEKGGVPLQQVIANQLTGDGQYVRRERSFAGVEFGPVEMTTNRTHAVEVSKLIGQMASFDREFMEPARNEIRGKLGEEGFLQMKDVSVGVASTSAADFASTVHNLVSQFLLAVKLDDAVNLAIESWKKGEKPVITLMNVNTSIIADFLQEEGIKIGDKTEIPFTSIMERYLERLRVIKVKTVDDREIRYRMTDADLGPTVVSELEAIRDMIANIPIKGLTGNPVDAIRDKMEAAGMKVDEITGRSVVVRNGIVATQKTGPSENKAKMNAFNKGALDALILSASGSTGFSLHAQADKKTNDGKQRHMIVLQAHPDINVFMQTLGRVHRTGQIKLPKYSLAFSDLAIEKRNAAVLMKKMASLNANTTAGKRSATTLDVVDFVNEVGDEVVGEYIANDSMLAFSLGLEVSKDNIPADFAKKATGRFIYLHPDEVETHYEAIEQLYQDKIRELEAAGTNPLEAKTLDLDARTEARAVLKQGGNSGSELDQDLVVERVSVKLQGLPMKASQVEELVARALQGRTVAEWRADVAARLKALMPDHTETVTELVALRTREQAAAVTARDEALAEAKRLRDKMVEVEGKPIYRAWQYEKRDYDDFYAGDFAMDRHYQAPGEIIRMVTVKGQRSYSEQHLELKSPDGTLFTINATQAVLVKEGPRPKGTAEEIVAAQKAADAARRTLDKLERDLTGANLALETANNRLQQENRLLQAVLDAFEFMVYPGKPFSITQNEDSFYAILTDVDLSKLGTNPTAQSRIRVQFAVADGIQRMSFPMSQVVSGGSSVTFQPERDDRLNVVKAAFDAGQTARRETRQMITGNLIAGIDRFKKTSGQVVLYTTDKGDTKPGILLPKKFDLDQELKDSDVVFPDTATAARFLAGTSGAILKSEDKLVFIISDGWDFRISVQVQRGKGRPYFQLKAVQPFITAFREQGKNYQGRIGRGNLKAALDAYSDNLGTKWIADSYKDEARAVIGVDLPTMTGTKESRFMEPVATLTGKELGEWSNMPQLRRKAMDWYDSNLGGSTVTNEATGWEITFAKGSSGKTVEGKGDVLVRLVPALREIVQRGKLSVTEPDKMKREGIKAIHKFAATVELEGRPRDVIVTVREGTDGKYYYSLTRDMSDGARFQRLDASTSVDMTGRTGPIPALEGNPVEFNIELTAAAGNPAPIPPEAIRPVSKALTDELRRMGLVDAVSPAVVRGLIGASGLPIEGRQRGARIEINEAAGDQLGTLRHEVVHVLRDEALWGKPFGLFTREEWKTLVAGARADKAIRARVERVYADLDAQGQSEEMVAELYRKWSARRDRSSPIGKALAKLAAFLRAAGAALRGNGFNDAAMVMERMAGGQVGARAGAAEGEGSTAEMRLELVTEKMKGMVGRKWRNPKQFMENALTDAMDGSDSEGVYSALALVPGRALFSELGKWSFAARRYLKDKEAMDALRNEWHSASDNIAQDWLKAGRKNAKANRELMDLMHETTITGIDPTSDEAWQHPRLKDAARLLTKMGNAAPEWAHRVIAEQDERDQLHEALRARFRALPGKFQQIYHRVRGQYDSLADEFELSVTENIRKGVEIAIKRAERRHRKELRRIQDEGLEGSAAADAIRQADKALAAVKSRGGWNAQARMSSLRQIFEENRLKGPYFPLARFGNFFVTVRDEKGKVVNFSRFESKKDQDAFVKEQEALNPGRVKFGTMDNVNELRAQVDPVFVGDIEGILADSGAAPEVMDSIWQRWLETLPDRSIRSSKIHRKNRDGFNRDAFRAFGKHMFHGAHQLARLKYGLGLEEHLNDASEEAERAADPVRAGLVVREMRRRHAFTMNPLGNAVVASMSGLAFIWYLGATPAAALANLAQTSVVGVPIMAGKWRKGGVSGAIAELTRATKDYAKGKGHTDKSVNLTDDERAAMRDAMKRGVIDKTQAHDLASVAETGIEYNATRERIMRLFGFFFHEAERFNREVTFLANYRLAKKAGLNSADAVDSAADMTWKIHFDYQNTSRPRVMQNDVGRLLTIFRQFTVNMLWRLARDSHQALRGATKEERAEARLQLAGITLSMMAHAGIKGTWGYGLAIGLLGMFAPGGSDDIEKWLHEALLMNEDEPGAAAWNYAMGAALNGAPGQILGIDLSERIGMPNLWFRGSDRDLEGSDLYASYVGEVLGPVFGIGQGLFRGVQLASSGEWYRGVETAVPKVVRDVLKGGRFASEGALTLNDDPLIEDMSWHQIIAQLSGFTPAQLAERYDMNNRLKNAEKRIMGERQGLHRRVGEAIKAGEGVSEELMEEIRAFNERFPEYPITAKSISQSYKARARASERNEFGIQLNPKLNARLREEEAPAIYN